jgi:adenylate cyclase
MGVSHPWYGRVVSEESELARLRRELERKTTEIDILTRVAVEISGKLDLAPLLDTILVSMDEVFGFGHSMVLLHDAQRERLVVAASRGYAESGVGAEVEVGKGPIGVVAKRKKLLRMGGMAAQRSYMAAVASAMEKGADEVMLPGLPDARSVVAIPLLKRDELIGVFYVESTEAAVFDDRDLSLIEAIGSQAAVEWNESSRRFIPYEFLAILGRDRLPEVRRGDHAELEMSTFFSDVRAYTTMVEGQGPEENFAFINEYLTYMEVPIRDHRGFIDSYRGDGIMALFAQCADDAVKAAVQSLEALQTLNEVRTARGDMAVRVGIGIDTGHLMLGTIGGARRLSAGVIGDSANTASRIESLTKRYGASVLISERTRNALAEPDAYRMRPVDYVRPKGKSKPIVLYEVLDGLPDAELQGKLAGAEAFEEGWRHYLAGQPGDGLVHFATALRLNPTDRAAQLYIGRCWHFIENGVPDDWDGVMTLTSK